MRRSGLPDDGNEEIEGCSKGAAAIPVHSSDREPAHKYRCTDDPPASHKSIVNTSADLPVARRMARGEMLDASIAQGKALGSGGGQKEVV